MCDDSDLCTGVEVCDVALGCQNGPALDCGDSNICNGVETCDPASGCVLGETLDCDDGDMCTVDNCDAIDGCVVELDICTDGGFIDAGPLEGIDAGELDAARIPDAALVGTPALGFESTARSLEWAAVRPARRGCSA